MADGRYKDLIKKNIINNQDIIKLINPPLSDGCELSDILLGQDEIVDGTRVSIQGHIFDFVFIPNTVTVAKVFICVEVENESIDNVFDNSYMADFILNVYIYTDKGNVQLSKYTSPTKSEMYAKGYYGNRIDMLCDAINNVLIGKENFGIGNVLPAPRYHSTIWAPNDNYYGKHKRYIVKNYVESGDTV